MDYRFAIADVFTDQPFGGNQLAVLPDARGLSPATMQALAREFGFAESTFLTPPARRGDPWGIRIFTPGRELPFAGHPTVGSAAVLAKLGLVEPGEVTLLEGIGPVPVTIGPVGRATRTEFTITREVELPSDGVANDDVAASISLPKGSVTETFFASVGVLFCFAHVASRELVDRAVLDRAEWQRAFKGKVTNEIFFFSGDLASGSELYARMFAPVFGIIEDAATGSAAAALAARLAMRSPGREGAWTIRQGALMQRPSLIETRARAADGGSMTIHVGGHTVLMGTGTLTLEHA